MNKKYPKEYKVCTKCFKEKHIDEFPNRKDHSTGKRAACKECHYKQQKEYFSSEKGKKIGNKNKKNWNLKNRLRHNDMVLKKFNEYSKSLNDLYIIKRIKYGKKSILTSDDIRKYPHLIEATRAILLLKRKLKELK